MPRGRPIDQRVDLDPVPDHRGDQLAGQIRRHGIAFRVGEMALEDRLGGPLPEVGLEDRGERESTAGRPASAAVAPQPTSAFATRPAVSLRRHRR